MKYAAERKTGSELIQVIATALMIEVAWIAVMLYPRWSHYSSWVKTYRAGVFAAVLVGLVATVTYVRWASLFSKTDESTRKEKRYIRSRFIAWVSMLAFMASQFLL